MKTTGVSSIPKFGLLDFLGHPNQYPHKYKVIRINIIAEGAIGHIFEEKAVLRELGIDCRTLI